MNRNKRWQLALAGSCAAGALLWAAPAAAQSVYTVDDASGDCNGTQGTLYWAIDSANRDGAPSVVEFDSAIYGNTIQLECPLAVTEELLWIASLDVTVDGSQLAGYDIVTFDASAGSTHEVVELVLLGGVDTRGMEIKPGQEVTLTTCTISENSSAMGIQGGGLHVKDSTLHLDKCTFYHNDTDNWGGAIYAARAKLDMVDTTFDKNSADVGGAILAEEPAADVIVDSSTFSQNSSTEGGAIRVSEGSGGAFLDVVNSTFSGNSAGSTGVGGAILLVDTGHAANTDAYILNSTFYGNTANQGSSIAGYDGTAQVFNTAFYRGTTAGICYAGTGFGFDGNHDIWNDTSCTLGTIAQGSLPNTNPQLDVLQGNGGPTLTHKPLAGSPVIGAGQSSLCPANDQRGHARSTCWMGSYE